MKNTMYSPYSWCLRSVVTIAVGGILFAAVPAFANPGMTGNASAKTFAAMDNNSDASVSSEEFFAVHKEMKQAAFAAIDTDGNGLISEKEWNAFFQDHSRSNSEAHGTMKPSNATAPSSAADIPGGAEKEVEKGGAASKEGVKETAVPDLILPAETK